MCELDGGVVLCATRGVAGGGGPAGAARGRVAESVIRAWPTKISPTRSVP